MNSIIYSGKLPDGYAKQQITRLVEPEGKYSLQIYGGDSSNGIITKTNFFSVSAETLTRIALILSEDDKK